MHKVGGSCCSAHSLLRGTLSGALLTRQAAQSVWAPGSIEAKSDGIGTGSEFVVRLPIPATSSTELPVPSIEPESPIGTPLRILCAPQMTSRRKNP